MTVGVWSLEASMTIAAPTLRSACWQAAAWFIAAGWGRPSPFPLRASVSFTWAEEPDVEPLSYLRVEPADAPRE